MRRPFFYASSACVYPMYRQREPDVTPLREEDAYPADPEPGYGLEKLFAEELCRYYREDHGLETRVARFHNVYGPLGTYEGGREKAPAAICRKVALARDGDEIEVWGDGQQTRSFLYVEDCVEGIYRLTQSDHPGPINLGSDELVTIDELVDLVAEVAGKRIRKRHDPTKPQGVRGRNSDNTRVREVLGWEPRTPLRQGLERTYRWIEGELRRAGRLAVGAGPQPDARDALSRAFGMRAPTCQAADIGTAPPRGKTFATRLAPGVMGGKGPLAGRAHPDREIGPAPGPRGVLPHRPGRFVP